MPESSSTRLSIVVTAYNEGEEVQRTLDSIAANTSSSYEVLLVDDGSTDGCCAGPFPENVRVLRRDDRIGIAHARNEASGQARGDVLAYLDAHQRLSPGCLDQCAERALQQQAIVWPDVRGLVDRNWTGHGASFRLCKERGFFTGRNVSMTLRHQLFGISVLRQWN